MTSLKTELQQMYPKADIISTPPPNNTYNNYEYYFVSNSEHIRMFITIGKGNGKYILWPDTDIEDMIQADSLKTLLTKAKLLGLLDG